VWFTSLRSPEGFKCRQISVQDALCILVHPQPRSSIPFALRRQQDDLVVAGMSAGESELETLRQTFKVVLLGDQTVGKTALAQHPQQLSSDRCARAARHAVHPSHAMPCSFVHAASGAACQPRCFRYTPTVGVELYRKELELAPDGACITLQVPACVRACAQQRGSVVV
jgi:hypothetical protein